MNYALHYARLITRAKGRTLPGYFERHHVVPRCLGGTNSQDNLADLTAEEHFIAHQLLVKMHQGHKKLIYAAAMMAGLANSNKKYGWLSKQHSQAMMGNTIWAGRRHAASTKDKIGNANRGHIASMETRNKMSASRRNKEHTEEEKRKIGESQRGRVIPNEARMKSSASHIRNRDSRKTKIVRADVLDIRSSSSGDIEIARKYQISPAYVWSIRTGRKWKDVVDMAPLQP